MTYLSCFTGVGGLESASPPLGVCEIDEQCLEVLRRRFPKAIVQKDVRDTPQTKAPIVVGGWPCQDLSVAGQQKGLAGTNSGLFYNFVHYAQNAGANTIIAENVPNLFKMESGRVFRAVVNELYFNGFKYVGWRTLNARNFGLPHQRNRLFIVASKELDPVLTLFRKIPRLIDSGPIQNKAVAGFYWTAGTQSICYSNGYIPTLKIGTTIAIPSPPAIHYSNKARLITGTEALSLQGFSLENFNHISKQATLHKMAGNAVAVPVGRFVVDGVLENKRDDSFQWIHQHQLFPNENIDSLPKCGLFDGEYIEIQPARAPQNARNLSDFIDWHSEKSLSQRAAQGLLRRLSKSGQACPPALVDVLVGIGEGKIAQA